jgi:hypothetical protein
MTSLEAAIASFGCKGCYQNHSMACENVGAERPLPHWILCNSDAWTLYGLMVILGQHLIGGLWFHKVSSPFINGQTTPSFSCSIKILWVWRIRKGTVFKGQLMPKRHYWLAQFFRLLCSFFHMYVLTPVWKERHVMYLNIPSIEDMYTEFPKYISWKIVLKPFSKLI